MTAGSEAMAVGRQSPSWTAPVVGVLGFHLALTLVVLERVGARPGVVWLAASVAGLLGFAFFLDRRGPLRIDLGLVLVAALLYSRHLASLAAGEPLAVRDAYTHIYGSPFSLVTAGHVASYDAFRPPILLHASLAMTALSSGLPLWTAAQWVATVWSLAILALVWVIAENLRAGLGMVAAAAFIVYAPANELILLQPMSLAALLFAFLLFLVVRRQPLALSKSLFTLAVLALLLVHLYSSAVLLALLGITVLTDSILRRRWTFVAPLAGLFAVAGTYLLTFAANPEYFRLLAKTYTPEVATQSGAFPTTDSYLFEVSALFRAWNVGTVTLLVGIAAVGWGLELYRRGWKPTALHVCATAFGAACAIGFLVPPLLPFRILTLAGIVVAPFMASAVAALPPAARSGALAILTILALTSVFAAHQFFPWTEGDPVSHALDEQETTGDAIAFVATAQGRSPTVVSSHPLAFGRAGIASSPFSDLNSVRSPSAQLFVFRDDALDHGYSRLPGDGGSSEILNAFRPYPSERQLELLDRLDRIGHAGNVKVYAA